MPQEELNPHMPTLVLFCTSAMTHIFPEIRLDGVRFVDLLLENTPDQVVEGCPGPSESRGQQVLHGYLGLLSSGTKFDTAQGSLMVSFHKQCSHASY